LEYDFVLIQEKHPIGTSYPIYVIRSDFLHVLDSCRDVYKLFTYDIQYIALDRNIFKTVLLVFLRMIIGGGEGIRDGVGGQVVELIQYSAIRNII
jgi:hypothetical protein